MRNLFFTFSKIVCFVMVIAMLGACQHAVQPSIVPAIEVKKQTTHSLGTIGEVEPIYVLPMKSPFSSRVDTGAKISSLDAKNVKMFERDGEKWVSFTMKNRETGESHRFEKEIVRDVYIKRPKKDERRYIVRMNVKIGPEVLIEEFTLADREKFEYQVLIGRNILTGRAVVDTSLSNTLY